MLVGEVGRVGGCGRGEGGWVVVGEVREGGWLWADVGGRGGEGGWLWADEQLMNLSCSQCFGYSCYRYYDNA